MRSAAFYYRKYWRLSRAGNSVLAARYKFLFHWRLWRNARQRLAMANRAKCSKARGEAMRAINRCARDMANAYNVMKGERQC